MGPQSHSSLGIHVTVSCYECREVQSILSMYLSESILTETERVSALLLRCTQVLVDDSRGG